MPWTKDNRPSRPAQALDVTTLDPDRVAVMLGEWYFREDKFGDVRGYTEDGRRTALKGATKGYTALENARNDAINGRWVCQDWPWCQHVENGVASESIEACVYAARIERNSAGMRGLKGGPRRAFRGTREYSEQ